jgi:hypothetical protein
MLPLVDEHAVTIAAPPGDVWPALLRALQATFSGPFATTYARAVRCADREPCGTLDGPGATVAGFRVTSAAPPAALVLDGRHAFSTYRLAFDLAPVGGGTLVRAETRASFPGPHGALYRLVVIRSGGHAIGMRRLLQAIKVGLR